MLSSVLLLAALAPQGPSTQIKINEFVYDHSGADVDEFVELYNAGTTAVDVSGWMLDGNGSNYPGSSNFDFTIPAATPAIPPGGFFVVANGVASAPLLALADVVVAGAPGGGWLQNGAGDGIQLRDAAGVIVDRVFYEVGATSFTIDPEQLEGAGIMGGINNFGYSVGALDYNSFSRLTDGFDTDDNGRDFRIAAATPGASNTTGYVDASNVTWSLDAQIAINGLAAGALVPDFGASCNDPELLDYSLAGIPPSPVDDDGTGTPLPGSLMAQFGCVASNDSIGGSNWLETLPGTHFTFESYVYIDTTPTQAGAAEMWHIGFQGTSAEFFNLPATLVPAPFGPDVTGAGLTYVVDDTSATLSIVDFGNGTNDAVIASMPAPSGWQRIRVQVTGNFIEAQIGGAQFANNGTVMSGAISGDGTFGGVYIGYRKVGVTGSGLGRNQSPFYADSVIVSGSAATADCFGVPTANSVGAPGLELTGLPYLGNAAFGFKTTGMLPTAPYNFLLGTGFPGDVGLDVSTVLPTPAGLTLWVNQNLSGNPPLATDAGGEGTFALGLPLSAGLTGLTLWAQAFQTDAGLAAAIPLSGTKAIKFTIGAF